MTGTNPTEHATAAGRIRAIVFVVAVSLAAAACSANDNAATDSDQDVTAPTDVTIDTEPADTEPGDTTTTDTEPVESLESFYGSLSDSLSAGDLDFSIERLDPVVFDLYSVDQCTATLDRLADPTFSIEFHSEERHEPWDFELPDGRSVPIDDTVVTTITLFGPGQPGESAESHVTIINGEYHWFTYC